MCIIKFPYIIRRFAKNQLSTEKENNLVTFAIFLHSFHVHMYTNLIKNMILVYLNHAFLTVKTLKLITKMCLFITESII